MCQAVVEMSIGEMSIEAMSVGIKSIGEMSVGEMSWLLTGSPFQSPVQLWLNCVEGLQPERGLPGGQ